MPPPDQLEPIAVDSTWAGKLFGVTRFTWNDWCKAGLTPAPVQIGKGQPRWNLDELRFWAAAGCPERSQWKFPLCIYPKLESFASAQQCRLASLQDAIAKAESRLSELNQQLATHGRSAE